ncbi:endospore germination permease [Bacillus sp. EB600]|uniref:GerAB/ArcD/ProY family transporter n=1 Tax=Bacillus sp. EB600 TaxID=2806345 RepID=UPI00210BC07E|nr:endospore germination permease [Bacillus sp. EB600]MCQ6279121.1 endospore germination permease [Bacillus sp. EB600]
MSQKISNFQLVFLVANFIFSASVISLPQIIVAISGQNGWLVPIIQVPILLLLGFMIFGNNQKAATLKSLFLIGDKSIFLEKAFLFFFLLFAVLTFLRDLRGLIDFVASVLLPSTPIDVLMVLSILVISYIAVSGIEVISRINMIYVVIMTIVVLMLPFLLLNEWELQNLQPLPSFQTILSLIQAVYFSFSWLGEMFIFLIIIANLNPVRQARKAVLTGTGLGLLLFFIVLFLQLSVLGTKIVKDTTYPTYILIQQINLTDFLDRIDLVIVVVWIPTIIAKLSYLLFAINHCLSYFHKSSTTKFLFPISIILGLLSVLLFENTMNFLHYSFYTWASLGLILEGIILSLFLLVKKSSAKRVEEIN